MNCKSPSPIHSRSSNGVPRPSPVSPSQSSSPSRPSFRQDGSPELDAPEPRRPRFRPPPPTVEDEVDSLAKEYGHLSVEGPAEDEAQSRGDVEQNPIMLEVHEHNPERRFVIVPNPADEPQTKTKDDESDSERHREGQLGDERPNAPPHDRKYEPVFDDKLGAPDRHPTLGRRRSRHELPPIDTTTRQERLPEHHRTRSAVGPRPEGFSARPSAQFRDDMLSPDVIMQGSSRRERKYYDYGTSTTSPRRLAHKNSANFADDRRREIPQRRVSVSPAYGGRSESTPDPRKSSRRLSIERPSESRYRDDTWRSSRRENVSHRRDGGVPQSASTPRPRGPRPCRDESRPVEEILPSTRTSGRRRGNSASVHQDAEPIISSAGERGVWQEDRSGSRAPTIPAHAPPTSAPPTEIPMNPRSSATFPITRDERQAYLPYPDDAPARRTERSSPYLAQPNPSVSMPEIPAVVSGSPGRSFETPQTATPAATKNSAWPPPFDPERDAVPPDHEMGSYRRYSEGRGGNHMPKFSQCQRKEPQAGLMDWLTLPRTDFNICPDCYQSVFANTEYRTQFQPILRPTDRGIACDFGSSPWYRIAWLLTFKNEYSDLRLFQQVDNVAASSRNQPCPGSRKAVRNWFTVRDPYKRRAVPNFTVCYQCAKTVEVLLPSLTGTFVPLDSRPEPLSSICALHFKPQRKRFALYFDTMETTADKAVKTSEPPDVSALASKIERLSTVEECHEDSPVPDSYWHTMQYIPDFTVCADCFDDVVRPRLGSDKIARNFYKDTQRIPLATCQLYSERMREIFKKACRRDDAKYLKAKVMERLSVEADIHRQLVKLDQERHDETWTEEQVGNLIREWKKWE